MKVTFHDWKDYLCHKDGTEYFMREAQTEPQRESLNFQIIRCK